MNPILAKDIKAIVEKKAFELNPNVLDNIFSHNTTATLGGAGLGAGIGALTNKKDRKGGALLGAGIGGLAGLGGSIAAPDASKQVNEFLVKNLVRQPLGRVATNVFPPIGYNQAHDFNEVRKTNSLLDIAKSIWKDKPVYEADMLKHKYDDRDLPYRKAFDLPGRYGLDAWKNNPDGSIAFNPDSKRGLFNILDVVNPHNTEHPLMRGYNKAVDGEGNINYSDVWDWSLHSDDKIDNVPNFLRYLINRIAKPAEIKGTIPAADANYILQNFKFNPTLQKKSNAILERIVKKPRP